MSSKTRPTLLALTGPDRSTVRACAAEAGFDVVFVGSLSDLLARLRDGRWTVTLVSLTADHVDGSVVERIAALPGAGSLLLTDASVSLADAVEMERTGAAALLREPIDPRELADRLVSRSSERTSVAVPKSLPDEGDGGPTLVGESPEIARVVEQIARVAPSDSTVLVTGESGTGKEVVARALHWASPRRDGPFVAVNCAAIPEHLMESELFGHERGAFTGAVARRVGRLERADGGTLFLDEIGDMSLVLQAKVLRSLEERTVEPVGGDRPRPFDARVVAATHRSLEPGRSEGRFREDLYYRLAVVELHLAPLRERIGDVRALALHFARVFADRHGRPVRAISDTALSRLEQAAWPGNVRELRNVIDRAVLLTDGEVIRSPALRILDGPPQAPAGAGPSASMGYPEDLSLAEVERHHIQRVLGSADGQIGEAAARLGIHRNTLARKLREMSSRTSEAEAS